MIDCEQGLALGQRDPPRYGEPLNFDFGGPVIVLRVLQGLVQSCKFCGVLFRGSDVAATRRAECSRKIRDGIWKQDLGRLGL